MARALHRQWLGPLCRYGSPERTKFCIQLSETGSRGFDLRTRWNAYTYSNADAYADTDAMHW
jgi:hypothetical protein